MDATALSVFSNSMGQGNSAPRAKKLVYVLNYVHPLDVQHFVHVMALLRALEERHGWEITLLSEKGGMGVREVHGHPVQYLSQAGGVLRLLNLARALATLRRKGCRLVFVRISKPAALVSSVVGRLIGMSTLYWQSSANHDLDRQRPPIARVIDDLIVATVIRLVRRFVTGPEQMLDYYAVHYGVPRSKLMLLYNDVDLARFSAPDRSGQRSSTLKVLFVHSLSPSKNAALYMPSIIRVLSAVAATGQAVQFDLIGEGPERGLIEAQLAAAGHGLVVRMLGAVPNTDLPAHLATADIFVMPSYREGMPRALMEAMAMGLPAVSTDAGGTRDIVGPQQLEFVVDRDDAEGFAERLAALANSEATRRSIGEENREFVRRFDTHAVAAMYDAKLSALL